MIRAFLYKNKACCIGFAFLLMLATFYVASGGGAVVTPHDQLDQFYSGLYIEHLQDGYVPEIMDGLSLNQILTGTLLFSPLYGIFDGVYAYLLTYVIVMLVAYCGMALLCLACSVRDWVAAIVAFSFASIPFFSTYGLTVMGIPLLAWSMLLFWRSQNLIHFVTVLLISMIFALGSGLVLIGYVVLLGILALGVVSCFSQPGNKLRAVGLAFLFLWTCTFYLMSNFDLFSQFFFTSASFVSHREEFVSSPSPVSFEAVLAFLQTGQEHGVSNQFYIFYYSFIVLGIALCCLLMGKNDNLVDQEERGRQFEDVPHAQTLLWLSKLVVMLSIAMFLIACFYVLFHSSGVVAFRNTLPSFFKSFQLDRFYLLYPTCWYLLFGVGTEIAFRIAMSLKSKIVSYGAFCLVALLTLTLSLPANDIVETAQKKLNPSSVTAVEDVTWDEFFGVPVFDEIKRCFPGIEEDGKTVSIGLFPSIALYNGFSCLDGYIANYSIDYKHTFGEVIEGELEKSAYLSDYFRNWGNRCYVFSSENTSFFTTKNTGASIQDLAINTEKLSEMGCRYVFSALPINNSDELHLDLKGVFESDEIPYEIWLYELKK